jgi:NADPH:quinone reductase-like Zn-dependent oxidoreductase
VVTTAGSARKLAVCRDLGADVLINYREQDFVEELGRGGADVILDVVGAAYLDRNIDALAVNGRLVVIGMQGGAKAELNLGTLLAKRAALIATSLRARPVEEKAAIVAAVRDHVWPLVEAGTVRPVVDCSLPLESAAEAHRLMESSEHIGKILLTL